LLKLHIKCSIFVVATYVDRSWLHSAQLTSAARSRSPNGVGGACLSVLPQLFSSDEDPSWGQTMLTNISAAEEA